MGFLSRIGVAIDSDLLTRFDNFIAQQGCTNRSEALRDPIRGRLVAATVTDPRAPVVATGSRLVMSSPQSALSKSA